MPDNNDTIEWYLGKFYILSNSRQSGMGFSPIAVSEIIILGSAIGTIGTMEEFIEVMQELDYIYLSGMKESESKVKKHG